MKLSTKVIISAVCLTTAGILIFALKKKNPTTIATGSQGNQVLEDFIKEHSRSVAGGGMAGAVKAALDFSRRKGLNPPRQDNVTLLRYVVQNGMNPADLVNQYESGV